jgi:hypothetical protein
MNLTTVPMREAEYGEAEYEEDGPAIRVAICGPSMP